MNYPCWGSGLGREESADFVTFLVTWMKDNDSKGNHSPSPPCLSFFPTSTKTPHINMAALPTRMEKEALKESAYKQQVQDLLKKHAPTFISTPEGSSISTELKSQYAAEQKLVDRIVRNETTAFAYGIALSGIVFSSVRFGPRWLTAKIGGKEKVKAMKEAEEVAKKAGNAWIQKGLCEFIHVSLLLAQIMTLNAPSYIILR